MIKKLLLSTVALGALSVSALAADLPSRRAPPVYIPPPIPVFTWTGLYIGGQVGYGFGTSNALRTAPASVTSVSGKPNGVIGGAHIGYNYGLGGFGGPGGFGSSGLVIGVEGDVDGSNYRSNYALGALSNTTRQDIQGSARGRLGVTFDRALFYATGGAAFGNLGNSYTNAVTGLNTSLSHTRVGWTVGAGVEYAISNNFSLRAEYRYTDFGSFSDTIGTSTIRHRETSNRVQAGFSYKFDTFAPVPVVARY